MTKTKMEFCRHLNGRLTVALLCAFISVLSGCLKDRDTQATTSTPNAWFAGVGLVKNLGGYPSAVKVTWAKADRSVLGYNIYSLRTNSSTGSNEWTLVGSVDDNQTSFTDSQNLSEGQVYTYKVLAVDALTGGEDENIKQASTVTFYGIAGVTVTGKTTANITLNGSTGAFNEIHIYATPKNGGGASALVATAAGNVASVDVTGLRSGVNYKFSARAYMSYLGAEDGNDSYILGQTYSDSFGSGKTNDTSFNYRGALNVQGFGNAPNATSGPTARQINLTWLPFISSSSTTKYKVVRSTTTVIDTTASTACTSSSASSCQVCTVTGSEYCEDTNVAAPPQTYYYAVTVVKRDSSGTEYTEELPCQNSADCMNMALYQIKAHVPPDYMALVQRDSANYEMCLNIKAYSDPRHNQRCIYTGLGAVPTTTGPSKSASSYTPGYYDFGYNLFIDRYKVACNWTQNSSSCGPNGCIDILSTIGSAIVPPGSGVGDIGNVFYGLQSNWYGQPTCYMKTSSGWKGVGLSSSNLTSSQTASAVTIDPGPTGNKNRPPLAYMDADGALGVCNSQSTGYGKKRLLRRREYLVASPPAYIQGEPNAITATSYIFNAPDSSAMGCIPTVTFPATISEWLSASSSAVRLVVGGSAYNHYDSGAMRTLNYKIGSEDTKTCVSRFGIQGIAGFGIMFSDTFIRTNGTALPAILQATSSDYDSGNLDHGSFIFNKILGPLAQLQSGATDYYYGGMNTAAAVSAMCSTSTTNPVSFIPAMGLPVCTWSGSTQNLRAMNEFELTGQIGSIPVTGNGYVANVFTPNPTTWTKYQMSSGVTGRFGIGFLPTSNYKYTNVFCAVEAE
jgi:hypothetical protein